jgi:hypothetical protein
MITRMAAPIAQSQPRSIWLPMSIDKYAALECATGMKTLRQGEILWRQVRPFLYRPLLPFKKYDLKTTKEGLSKLAAFQHSVKDGQSHNSYMNPIVFDELRNYDVNKLRGDVRRSIKRAQNNSIKILRCVDEEEFSKKAYPVYLSFYDRTKFDFETSRRQEDGFSRWARAVFRFPEVTVLGAFVDRELVSFEISCLVEDTLIVKTVVHSDKALKLGAPDLLLHHYRMSVFEQPEIRWIYDSMLAQNPGANKFKLVRGAKVLPMPAYLHIHPVVLAMIRIANKRVYGRLRGLDDSELLNLSRTGTYAA